MTTYKLRVMAELKIRLSMLQQTFAVCRLKKNVAIPVWVLRGSQFSSITASPEEISIVFDETVVPPDVKVVRGWRAFKADGALDLSTTGVIAMLSGPPAEAGISVFTLSRYDTYYLLAMSESFEEAVKVLSGFCEISN